MDTQQIRQCQRTGLVMKFTKATLYALSVPTLRAVLECDDLTMRERRAVEGELASRPMRAYVSTGGIGPAPR